MDRLNITTLRVSRVLANNLKSFKGYNGCKNVSEVIEFLLKSYNINKEKDDFKV